MSIQLRPSSRTKLSALHIAVEKLNIAKVGDCLKNHDFDSDSLQSSLIFACRKDIPIIFNMLLIAGANGSGTNFNNTPFITAVKNCSSNILQEYYKISPIYKVIADFMHDYTRRVQRNSSYNNACHLIAYDAFGDIIDTYIPVDFLENTQKFFQQNIPNVFKLDDGIIELYKLLCLNYEKV